MRRRRWVHRAMVAAVVATAALTASPSEVVLAEVVDTGRVAGPSRFETAVAISQRAFPGSAPTVYVARGDVLVDALAAGVLRDGPVLLVPACGAAPAAVIEEVERLQPREVMGLGGPDAVCQATLDQVSGTVRSGRLAGGTRYETAVEVSQRVFPGGSAVVYLASGLETAPDAVAGGALTDGPILLVPRIGGVPRAVLTEIQRLQARTVIALGGPLAVSQADLDTAAAGRAQARLSGADRRATAVAVSQRAFPQGSGVAYLAQESVFADAVAAGSLTDGPVLLVPSCGDLPPVIIDELERLGASTVLALGGPRAVCDSLLSQALTGGPPPPTEGPTVKVFHLVPSDGEPTPGIEASMSHELGLINDWLRTQTGGYGLRFPTDADGRPVGQVVRVDVPTDDVRAQWQMRDALSRQGLAEPFNHEHDYDDVLIVYADFLGDACGAAQHQVAVLYMESCNIYPSTETDRFPRGATYLATHEFMHVLGAVPSCAPNHGNVGHVVDTPTDLLYQGPEARAWDALQLDTNHDDYFRHGRADCPDIDDSPFWDR